MVNEMDKGMEGEAARRSGVGRGKRGDEGGVSLWMVDERR